MMWYYRLIACPTALGLIGKSAIESLPDHSFPREVPGGKPVLLLKKFRNHDLSLGLLGKRREVVKYGSLLVGCLVLLRLSCFLPKRGRKIEKAALTLMSVGGESSLFDRFFRDYVIDYPSFTPKKLYRLVFNLEDLYITASMVVLSAMELTRSLRRVGIKGVKH